MVSGCSTSSVNSKSASNQIVRVIDGDTIVVAGDERVRLIGIDTPEKGECGFEYAKLSLENLLSDGEILFFDGAASDTDKYGRLLRYVEVSGVDAGLQLITEGLAIARYDSRDGYGKHDREDQYIKADNESLKANGCQT